MVLGAMQNRTLKRDMYLKVLPDNPWQKLPVSM